MASFKIAKMIFKSFFGKPATDPFPFVPREYFDETRGHIEIKQDECILCGICQKKCPSDAIEVDRDERKWIIKRMSCIQCSCCVNACPKKCLTNDKAYTTPDTEKVTTEINIPKAEGGATGATSGGEEKTLKLNKESCVYCTLCAKKCPSEAITVNRDEKSWSVDKDNCTTCGICVDACPKDSLSF